MEAFGQILSLEKNVEDRQREVEGVERRENRACTVSRSTQVIGK